MRRPRSASVLTLFFALLLTAGFRKAAGPQLSAPPANATPAVVLRAASGATTRFVTNNGQIVEGAPPEARHVPHLVLYRNGALTAAHERTLIVAVTGIAPPPGGVTVTLAATTEHTAPDTTPSHGEPILVWREERRLPGAGGDGTVAAVVFTHTFGAGVMIDEERVPTPSDYFRYRITVAGAAHGGSGPPHQLEGDHAFLMENQWLVSLPEVREESAGAAPDELVMYFCDMFPFRKGLADTGHGDSRLLRSEVAGIVRADLIPAMIDAFRTQSDIWGFSWHDAWISYRAGGNAERLSVALTDGHTWFHGSAPVTGNSGISINTNPDDEYANYRTLADALVSTFHHELFHNMQRSVSQGLGGDGRVDGADHAWQFFSEGTAFLASSVGLPRAHFSSASPAGRHVTNATALRAQDAWSSRTLQRSSGALYWRFLYEQCGGMRNGIHDPAAGMTIVRNALSALYSRDIVDIESTADLLGGLPRVMDHALAETPSCPFHTFEESYTRFARAIYALRLADGRCAAPGLPSGCGFYDPDGLYPEPPVSQLGYAGSELRFTDAVRYGYGMEYVNVILYPDALAQPMVLEVEGASDGRAEFSVQVWRLVDSEPQGRPRPDPEQTGGPEALGTVGSRGRVTYSIAAIDVAEYTQLGIIIVRVDPNEDTDPVGEYTIRLTPAL